MDTLADADSSADTSESVYLRATPREISHGTLSPRLRGRVFCGFFRARLLHIGQCAGVRERMAAAVVFDTLLRQGAPQVVRQSVGGEAGGLM